MHVVLQYTYDRDSIVTCPLFEFRCANSPCTMHVGRFCTLVHIYLSTRWTCEDRAFVTLTYSALTLLQFKEATLILLSSIAMMLAVAFKRIQRKRTTVWLFMVSNGG